VRLGDRLNGYEIVTEPTNAGGGMSQWAFARKDDVEYFLKMFLAPKYPLDDGPGSPAAKERKRAVCIAFEERHLEIAGRIDPEAPGGGNLVVAREFFRVESTYVKVMDTVIPAEVGEPHLLSGRQLLVILRSLAFSLRLLHAQQIVHGDLKPDNVMLQRAADELYTSKLIDFDEAYVVGRPPTPQQIVGDPSYYSPELLRYIKEDERLPSDALSTASDMFSLGLLISVLLTGEQPGFDRSSCNYPAEAILVGEMLDVSSVPVALGPIVAGMLRPVPAERPTIDDLIEVLTSLDAEALKGGPRPVADAPPPPPPVPEPVSTPEPAPIPAPVATPPPRAAPTPSSAPSRPLPPPPPPLVPTPEGGAGESTLRSTMGRRSRPVPPR
jgi:serine/threonine protein kinase